jgi:hypothetical protein
MNSSTHLPVLQSMFPGKLMLDVDDIAKCLNVSKGHIYNLVHKEKLPLSLRNNHGLGDKVMVSIGQMARYLDGTLWDSPLPVESKPGFERARKVGRPRGSTKANLELQLFQSELKGAILRFELGKVFSELRQAIDSAIPSPESSTADQSRALEVLVLKAQVNVSAVRMIAVEAMLFKSFKTS